MKEMAKHISSVFAFGVELINSSPTSWAVLTEAFKSFEVVSFGLNDGGHASADVIRSFYPRTVIDDQQILRYVKRTSSAKHALRAAQTLRDCIDCLDARHRNRRKRRRVESRHDSIDEPPYFDTVFGGVGTSQNHSTADVAVVSAFAALSTLIKSLSAKGWASLSKEKKEKLRRLSANLGRKIAAVSSADVPK